MIGQNHMIPFCFIVTHLYDRKVKQINAKHFSSVEKEQKIQSLRNYLYERYDTEAIMSQSFQRENTKVAIKIYKTSDPQKWLVKIRHFETDHTFYTVLGMLNILNYAGLRFDQTIGFYVSRCFELNLRKSVLSTVFMSHEIKRKKSSEEKNQTQVQ